jgi:hypothetical protein
MYIRTIIEIKEKADCRKSAKSQLDDDKKA